MCQQGPNVTQGIRRGIAIKACTDFRLEMGWVDVVLDATPAECMAVTVAVLSPA